MSKRFDCKVLGGDTNRLAFLCGLLSLHDGKLVKGSTSIEKGTGFFGGGRWVNFKVDVPDEQSESFETFMKTFTPNEDEE